MLMTYFLNVFLRASPERPCALRKIKIIEPQKSINFLLGMLVAAVLFLFFHAYKERETFWRFVFRWLGEQRKRQADGARILDVGAHEYCCQCHYLEAFLKVYQPEIIATLINVLQMAEISLEDYFETLEIREDWPKFQSLMGEVSLMVMEQSKIPEGPSKEAALMGVRERYIPKLIVAIEDFRATFD